MNELREKIEYYVLKYGNDRVEFHGQDIDREPVLNAIIDAVIAALPEYKDGAYHQWSPVNWKPIEGADNADAGYNEAIERTRSLLQAAKENK